MFKKIFSSFLLAVLVLSLSTSPLLTRAAYSQTSALTYLQNSTPSAWTILGQVALGATGVSDTSLKNLSGSSAIDYEIPILAISALGENPASFYGSDYVTKLKNFHANSQLGDATALNDDIFGILALKSSGLTCADPVIVDSKTFLLAHQNSDGGWGYSTTASSDSNTTAAAMVALSACGATASDTVISHALTYLKTAQNSDGGFTYDPTSSYGTGSDSSSTAWVIWALNSLGQSLTSWSQNGTSPADYLKSNQDSSGYFKYQSASSEDSFSPITTAYAAIALAGKTLPLASSGSMTISSFNFRIEGSASTVCSGKAQGPTALDVVINAASQCGFTYAIQQMSFGPYLKQIGTDIASGDNGWMYMVNYQSPSVGANTYQLSSGDQVLWYFGSYNLIPTRLALSAATVSSGQSATASVEYYANGSWSALSGATVNYGAKTAGSDASGQATLAPADGYYKTYAEKTGYIRSNTELLQVGNPSSSSVALSATLSNGSVAGTSTENSTLAFSVDTTGLDFGTVKPGSVYEKQLTLTNSGTSALSVNSYVTGDDLFTNHLQLNSKTWKNFSLNLAASAKQSQTAKLIVPENYDSAGGLKTGTLIFWATAE